MSDFSETEPEPQQFDALRRNAALRARGRVWCFGRRGTRACSWASTSRVLRRDLLSVARRRIPATRRNAESIAAERILSPASENPSCACQVPQKGMGQTGLS